MAEAAQSRGEFIEYYIKTKDNTAHWKELGVLLGIEISELQVIETDNKKSADCLMKMLDIWLKNNPVNPEKQLDNALKRLNNKYPNGEKYYAHMWLAARKQSSSSHIVTLLNVLLLEHLHETALFRYFSTCK